MRTWRLPVICMAVVSLCGCAAGLHENVPLVWKPTNDLYDVSTVTLTGLRKQHIKVAPFADSRENKNEIARNVEHEPAKPVTTKDDVAAWCTERFKAILQQFGLTVVEKGESVLLKGEVIQFHVLEENVYKATVGIRMTVASPDGAVLWEGMMTGTNKRFGRSYKLENYHETLSDAYLEAVQGLLKNGEFIKAMQRGGWSPGITAPLTW